MGGPQLRLLRYLPMALIYEGMTCAIWWDDDGYWIALWLHQINGQWVVLDSCRWNKHVVF